jgi:YgiT-type zinc finger domain-containing protein
MKICGSKIDLGSKDMKPDKCNYCKGKLHEGKTEFVVKSDNEIISIKDVPALICENCGESYFTPATSRKIDKVMKEFHEGKLSSHPISASEVDLQA